MARIRDLEKYEIRALGFCEDPQYREKLTKWVQSRKEPLDSFQLKKLKDKIDQHNHR